MEKILVTGGSGFIGNKLCERLLQEGHRLYLLTRNKPMRDPENSAQKCFFHDFREIEGADIDIVIHLAGENIARRWTETVKQSIYRSRIETTRSLANFMRSAKIKPKLFISASAIGYYGTDIHKTFTEESGASTRSGEFTSALCKEWENEALSAVPLGIRTVVLRIGPVLAKNGGMLAQILPLFYLGLGYQIGDGKQWFSWIDREDLIKLILFIMGHSDIHGAVNATSPGPVTNKEFSLALAKAINRPIFIRIPALVFQWIFGQMADELIVRGQKVLPKKALDSGFVFSYPNIEESLANIFSTSESKTKSS